MKFHLIITLDYELFGNGTGCLNNCVVAPTARCLKSLQQYGAPLSFFIDTAEFIAIRSTRNPFSEKYRKVEQQLVDAVGGGHFLQLHLHPQWQNAQFEGEYWKLDLAKWRIGSVEEKDAKELVADGLVYLQDLTSKQQGHGTTFRAGGWAIQPSQIILKVLREAGVLMESTVAPGAFNPARGDWFDFRSAPTSAWWEIQDDINTPAAGGGILEVPITTAYVGRLAHVRALKEHRQGPSLPDGCSGSYAGPNSFLQTLIGKLVKFMRMGQVMLDFSTMPAWLLIEITKQYIKSVQLSQDAGIKNQPIPIVAIGHNKNFTINSQANLEAWLDWVSKEPTIEFSDYNRWRKALLQRHTA